MRRRAKQRHYRKARIHRQPSIYNRTSDMNNKKKGIPVSFIFFMLVLFGSTYLVFFSPVLAIKNIEISNTRFIDRNKLENLTRSYTASFLNKNILSINISRIEKELENSFSVKEINIFRKFPNTIILEIEEREPVFVLDNIKGKYLIDTNGYAFLVKSENYENIQSIKDFRNIEVIDNSRAFHGNLMDLVININKDFKRLTDTDIKSIELINTIDEIKVNTKTGWYVYFNPEYSAANQLVNLSRVLQDAKNKNIKVEYVDLRAENKIFYK